jgi:aspartyl-tRNA(Asn)/glutamyl-tRNA(Gln) amidotransferase subunit A
MNRFQSLREIRIGIENGNLTCRQLVEYYLTNIKEKSYLNAFLEVFEDEALLRADETDEKLKNGTAGKLAGLVIALKDNICYKGHKISASSKILEGFTSLYSSTVVERLLQQDAIIIGRTNCDEFAMGSSNENSAFGTVKNAFDQERVPGGSSGGSAVAVQADFCLASLGSDTGGSIRQPASFTGLVGFKPTYGRVSRHGLLAFASSFDQIGPFTKNIEDAALIMEVIAGKDEYDSTVSSAEVPEYSKHLEWSGKSSLFCFANCVEGAGLDEEIRLGFKDVVNGLEKEGHSVETGDFPYLEHVVPAYYVLATAEASSNLSRYGGMLYGYRDPEAKNLEETILKSRSNGFGKEVQRRIMLGTFVLSEGYYDAYYTRGQKMRRILHDYMQKLLDKHDFVILPTTPTAAFKFGEKAKDPIAMYLADIFTVQANLSGFPAISLPLRNLKNGLPYGFQVIGRKYDEKNLLAFSHYLMKNFKIGN